VNHREFASRLRGVFGFPVTPFKTDLSLDLKALERNVDEMAAHPFCGMVAAGGTGELYSLAIDEIESVVRTTVEVVNGRMPVVAGAGFNTPMGVEIAKRVAKAGADSILVLPPYYSNAPFEGVVDFYEAIGEATDLPLMIYSRDWAAYTPQQAARIAERVPSLVCWKDGQGDVRKYQRIMQYVGNRLAWVGGLGDDCIPGYFSIGVQAYTSSISNIAPKLSIELAKAGMARDFACLDRLMAKYVQPLYAIRERRRGYEVSVMKQAMDILGMPGGPVRPPLTNVLESDVADIRTLMDVYQDVL
jgi:5-dehydro-4-deoxyglucarate dehydratase